MSCIMLKNKILTVIKHFVPSNFRTESTPHMLIDFSDILQIDVYELGRTYLRLSQALCINIPAMDPCLYVMRFAHRLELGDKTHEVSMTALRLVSRMKKDWIHFGRRPSGLCGAALLIAARMHGYNRSVYEVIKVVKVHESTLRKRLNEFGETPTSQLTLDEFMNIDLDAMTEEQDPPSFKAARKRDRERLLEMEKEQDLDQEITDLEDKIEDALADMRAKMHKRGPNAKHFKDLQNEKKAQRSETSEEDNQLQEFIAQETLGTIDAIVGQNKNKNQLDSLLMPPPGKQKAKGPVGVVLKDSIQDYLTPSTNDSILNDTQSSKNDTIEEDDGELDLTGIDDTEIEGYIMTDKEIEFKTKMWMQVNAEYLKEQAEKAERERKEQEEAEREGREIKKKPRKPKVQKKKEKDGQAGHNTAIEAIEKIVAEKKISTKINYDVLRSLNSPMMSPSPSTPLSNFDDTASIPSPSIFGSTNINESSNPNAVFTPSLNKKRLSSFRKDRDLSLKRPPASPIKDIKPKRSRLSSTSSETSNSTPVPSPLASMGSPASPQKSVIVESGPVTPGTPVVEHEHADDFDEDDEEPQSEHENLSVRELLSRHTGVEYSEEFEEEEEYY